MSTPLLRSVLVVSTLSVGCQEAHDSGAQGREQDENEASTDGGPSGDGDASSEDPSKPTCENPRPLDKVDLLFVIDNSGSMRQEQESLAEQLPRLVHSLATGDLGNGGSTQDFAPVSSLHLGVVSTDMGTDGAYTASPRVCQGLGDDGVLLSRLTPEAESDPACALDLFGANRYLEYQPSAGDSADAAREFACVAALGTEGCGLEQQLEAMHKALQPRSVADFVEGLGHGDRENRGFLRDDAVLAVVHVSDEEDCSITKQGRILFDLFNGDPRFVYDGELEELKGQRVGLNARCAYEASARPDTDLLQPIDRFVKGLLSLKPGHAEHLVYAAVVGVPESAENLVVSGAGENAAQDFGAILALEEMQFYPGDLWCTESQLADPEIGPSCGKPAVDGPSPPLPRPACTGAGGSASPGRRFVQVADQLAKEGLGTNAMVRSICSDDFTGVTQNLLGKIAHALEGGDCGE